jgi:hypothetical protein
MSYLDLTKLSYKERAELSDIPLSADGPPQMMAMRFFIRYSLFKLYLAGAQAVLVRFNH